MWYSEKNDVRKVKVRKYFYTIFASDFHRYINLNLKSPLKMFSVDAILSTRQNFISLIDSLTVEELNHIPKGFRNNIIWNFGHIVVTQQLLCYKLSGNKMYLDDNMVEAFKKGTAPSKAVDKNEIDQLKEASLSLVNRLEEDLKEMSFDNYTSYTTSYGITLNNIEEAIKFNGLHEALHFGYTLSLRKIVKEELATL